MTRMARLERSRTRIAGAVDGLASAVLNARLVDFNNRVINPVMITLGERGLLPPTYALLETLGRRTGLRRRVPVANGLDGDTFWLIAGLGERASFVRNVRVDPRVRVKARPAHLRDGLRARWRSGTAHPLPDDDPRARHRQLGHGRPGYRLDGILLRALDEGNMLTVRIDLDPEKK
jgi:deazaflavin-dependent oxidoreductase (nitroreductase family)